MSDTPDLVKRLKAVAEYFAPSNISALTFSANRKTITDAISRLEQLERENLALRTNTPRSTLKRLDVQLREP